MAAHHRSMAQNMPSVTVNGHHHHNMGHHQHHMQPSMAGAAVGTSTSRAHGTGMGMVALGGGVSGGGICGGGPFRAFRQGRMTSDL